MATIVLSAVGAGLGASIGGGIMGLSSVAIGRAVGAIAGSMVDNALMGGSVPVEHGRLDRLRVAGASEGAAIGQVFGRMRLGGQVIWASPITEHANSTGSGKGFSSTPSQTDYSYTMSLAIALCEGEITRVGRVWADGQEIAPDSLNMRVYPGSESQQPDAKIEAVEGVGNAPAFRGTAYVVIEDLDLTTYGNRVPVLNFEVVRPEQPDEPAEIARGTKAVAIIPGTGEYALATTVVHHGTQPGDELPVNENTPQGKSDFAASLEMLEGELPNLEAVSLVVCWFGNDLRCGDCEIAPKVERNEDDGHEIPWSVSGLTRSHAGLVPLEEGNPIYGGTPTDASVVEAITALKDAGKAVTFYPFILMTQQAGNGLPDPYSDATDQPVLPWRGRITLSNAPGQAGSPDQSAAAEAEVAAFFGTAQPGDFSLSGRDVIYTGPDEWSYRRFILHYAFLCQAAGGVEAFLIGSELRGLTQIRGAGNTFPVVAQLVQLAADVRGIFGPDVNISYAADWSEYFGHHPGGGEIFFHLDPLWADDNISFIGIDNYMPLSDWRDGVDHVDSTYGSIYNLDYLKANIMGGEGYDWYYHAPEARAVQRRTEISDGAYGEPWVWRYKDIRSWWLNAHHDRPGGIREADPTDWIPGSKPIRFTEFGCAAIDKGTNQPNKFLDPKSSESALPRYSNGQRDDFIQMQYLRAHQAFWAEPDNNPVDAESGVQMLDTSRMHVWAWDARPFPWFPSNRSLWSDAENYTHGHWLNGRASNRALASVVTELAARSGVWAVETSRLYGLLRGYGVGQVTGARNALQPLMMAYGFDAAERAGEMQFFSRTGLTDHALGEAELALVDEIDGTVELIRTAEAELAGRVRLSFVESDGSYESRSAEAVFPDEPTRAVSQSELPLVLTGGEGRAITERWLAEARVARDTTRFALPQSALGVMAGDVVALDPGEGAGLFRIDRVEQTGLSLVEATRVEPLIYAPAETLDIAVDLPELTPAVPVLPLFMDLPLLTGDEVPHAPHLAVTARPWPGRVALYRAPEDDGYGLIDLVRSPARLGVTETPLIAARSGLLDRGPALRVRMSSGDLSSASLDRVLNGANVALIGDGSVETWEVIQFTDALLVEPDVYEISGRLRGQAGSDALMPEVWPVGSYFVLLDSAVDQIPLPEAARGLDRHYRIGPASKPLDDASYRHQIHAFNGIGLRPLSPVHLRGEWQGGDLALSWVRRTRIGGDSWAAEEVPLGEEAELYRIRVMGGATLLREQDVKSADWTYTAAMQGADGVGASFAVEVAQVSQSFGPGPSTRLSISV